MSNFREDFFTLARSAQAVDGRFFGEGMLRLGPRIIDSRRCGEGDFFIALSGENSDGHEYLEDALRKGASAALVNEEFWEARGESLRASFPAKGFIVVPDTLKGLQKWAASYREEFLSDALRIGITGSSGKTTVKEILGSILTHHGSTGMNPGNLNSDIGLPLTLLDLPPHLEYAVLEMGVNRRGEMDELVEVFRPQMALITHIGTAHIGPLGSRQGIAEEKKKIFRHLTTRGGAVIWDGDGFKDFLLEDVSAPVLIFGEDQEGFEGATDLGFEGWILHMEGRSFPFPLMGRHNLLNALAAVTASRHAGASWEAVAAGLAEQKPLFGRGEVFSGAVTVVVDCYNANPESFLRGLETLNKLPWKGRKILVAGAMGELGGSSEEAHRLLGCQIAGEDLDAVFFFGSSSQPAWEAASRGDFDLFFTDDYPNLEKEVLKYVREGDLVYLKGSRVTALERLIEPLRSFHV